MARPANWRIKGQYFESCNCELLCPCLLSHAQARPTEGHCDVVLATHIDEGDYEEIDLSGLNAVQALTTPGPMAQGNGALALYLDARATEAQRLALEAIFGGNAGGPPSLLAAMITQRLPSHSATINFSATENRFHLMIEGITDVTVESVAGLNQRPVWLDNVGHPYSSRLAAAKATVSRFHDQSFTFDNSGRNGHFSAITWCSGK
jgi:hypothetical protein